MKKFIALLLALVMVLSLAACSVEKAEEPAPAATEAPPLPLLPRLTHPILSPCRTHFRTSANPRCCRTGWR